MKQTEKTSVHLNLPTPFVEFLTVDAAQHQISRNALITNILETYIETPLLSNFELGQKIILAHANATNALNYHNLNFPDNNNPFLEDTVYALSQLCDMLK